MLLRTVRTAIEKYGMLVGGERVVVAVSGGPDSVALLHILSSVKAAYAIELHAAHLEHGLRAEASLDDMKFVETLCRGLGVPLTAKRVDVRERAASSRLSLEAVARQARYAFFEEVLAETGATKIATGHNANDQAETLLLKLLRGSGIAGLRGIRPAIEGKIIRPLIEAKRGEVIAYLEERGLAYRIDASNEDVTIDRNRVRRLLIPLIEKEFNPRIVDSLGRTASIFALVAKHFDKEVEALKVSCCNFESGRITLDLKAFAPTDPAVKLFTLYSLVRTLEDEDQVVSFDALGALASLADESPSGSRLDIGSGILAVREYDKLIISRGAASQEVYAVQLSVPGMTRVEEAGCSFEVGLLQEPPDLADIYVGGRTAYFDSDKLALPLIARNWRGGDRFIPFGLGGSKKVHDVFIDERIPASERGKTPIVCDGESILWVSGVRRAERARVTERTRTTIKITYRKDGEAIGTAG